MPEHRRQERQAKAPPLLPGAPCTGPGRRQGMLRWSAQQPAYLMQYALALRPALAARDRLAGHASRLRSWNLPAEWVDPEDYLVSMAFLGRLDATSAEAMPQAVDLVARSMLTPHLELVGLGASGGRSEPRVVYAALRDGGGLLTDLHCDLCDAAGLVPERAFLPHIVICRPGARARNDCSGPARGDWPQLLEAHGQAEWGRIEVTEMVLLEGPSRPGAASRALARWSMAA
jgi:2'-5' RNA ligase